MRQEMPLTSQHQEKRLFSSSIDPVTQTLIDNLNLISMQTGDAWSFSGGFARDLYLNFPWNDYDICSNNAAHIEEGLLSMGLLEKGSPDGGAIPHDYYIDPYDFNKQRYPIHWIHADNRWAYAPLNFDFTINLICYKPDGYFYAPATTWQDLDNKIIRKHAHRMTPNTAMRAIRFMAKYQFSMDEELEKEIKSYVQSPLDTRFLIRNAKKMQEDGVGESSFILLKEFGFPEASKCESIEEYIHTYEKLLETGQGHIQAPVSHYNFW